MGSFSNSASDLTGRIQQPAELVFTELGLFPGDVDHQPALRIGSLGDGRAALVADDRVQRRDKDGIGANSGDSMLNFTIQLVYKEVTRWPEQNQPMDSDRITRWSVFRIVSGTGSPPPR